MAFLKDPTIGPGIASSPYKYLGSTASTSLAPTLSNTRTTPGGFKVPQMPGFTQPNLGLGGPSPYTSSKPTDPYKPGIVNYQAGGNPADQQAVFNNLWATDPTRVGQVQALNEQLRSRWGTDVLSKARNAELFFGAAPRNPAGAALDLSQFGGTGPLGFSTEIDPTTGLPTTQGPSLGESLASVLLDPTLLQQASENKYSVISEIGRQLANRDAATRAQYRGGAVQQLLNEHQVQADRAIQEGANQFLSVLNDLYSGWLGNLETAGGQYTQYGTDAFNRIMQLVANNIISLNPHQPPPPEPQPPGGGGGDGGGGDEGYLPLPGLSTPIPSPTYEPSYAGTGAGGFTGSTTPPAVIMPRRQTPSSENSPYYYGGGGFKPRR